MNPYQYTFGNPVNYVDPSGLIVDPENDPSDDIHQPPEAERAIRIIRDLKSQFNIDIKVDFGWMISTQANIGSTVTVNLPIWYPYGLWDIADPSCGRWREGAWTISELNTVKLAVERMSNEMTRSKFTSALGHVQIDRHKIFSSIYRSHAFIPGLVVLTDSAFYTSVDRVNVLEGKGIKTTIHELGHVWDWRSGGSLSSGMRATVSTTECSVVLAPSTCNTILIERPPGWDTPSSSRYLMNLVEDWAHSVAAYFYPEDLEFQDVRKLGPQRTRYIENAIANIN